MTQFKINFLFTVCSLHCWLLGQTTKIPQFAPQGYHLDLFPDVDTKLVKGLVSIDIATYAEPTNVIELDADPAVFIHYKSIKVNEFVKNGKLVTNKTVHEVSAVERILYDTGKLRIHVTEKLQRDVIYQVHISFESPLKNESYEEPFYLKKYVDANNTERSFAIMDLTGTGCFKAFPCFSDRIYKSWIVLTVTRKASFYAFSAVPVNYTAPASADGQLVKDYFHRTPPISMNSLALIVSDFKMVKSEKARDENNETEFSKHEIPAFVFDVEIIKQVIKKLEEYLSLPFPVSSYNVMAYPNAANLPYIEAYGLLLTYSPPDEFTYIRNLVEGALSQWFYHTATPVSSKCVVNVFQLYLAYRVTQEVAEDFQYIIKSPFNFQQISFVKGVPEMDIISIREDALFSVIAVGMLESVYGPKLLPQALHLLYRKKEFKMYSDLDVWNAINEVLARINKHEERHQVHHNLKALIESWNSTGFLPLVTVRRDYNGNRINVTQEPFLYGNDEFKLYEARENASYFQPRVIPLVFSQPSTVFSSNEELLGWMSTPNHTYELKLLYPVDYIVVNPAHLAFFVTNYDERNWELLVENFHSLPMSIKLQLLFDSMVLANMNRLDYSIFLRMSSEMVSNEEYLPLWIMYSDLVRNQMNWFHGLVGRKYREFVLTQTGTFFDNIPKDKYNSYPVSTKNRIEKEKKRIKYELNCSRSRSSCFTLWEYELFMYEVRMGKRLTGDHNCEIVKSVSLMDWEIIANGLFHALKNNVTDQKTEILDILACTENSLAFETFMNLMFLNFNGHGLFISDDDQEFVLSQFSHSQHNMLLNFVNKNFFKLKERLHGNVWKALMKSIIVTTRSDIDLKNLFNFFNKNTGQFEEADDLIREGLVIVSKRVNRELEVYPIIENWLDSAIEDYKKFAA